VYAKTGEWLSAIKYAYRSHKELTAITEDAPGYAAAWLGVGVFNYYLSQNLKWVPFFGNRTEEGIAQVERSVNAPFPFDIAARNSLCWIYIDQEWFTKAETVAQKVLDQFPHNSVFTKIIACIKLWTNRWDDARVWGEKLVSRSQARVPVDWVGVVTGYHIVVSSCFDRKACDCVRESGNRCRALPISKSFRKISYIKEYLGEIENMIKDCE